MLRGRRKCRGSGRRTAQSATDVPSDSPKRKDSKLEFHGRLSHASPRVADPRITQFFPKVEASCELVPLDVVALDLCISPAQELATSVVTQEKTYTPHQLLNVPADDLDGINVRTISSSLDEATAVSTPAAVDELSGDKTSVSQLPVTPHKILVAPTVQPPVLSPSSALSQLTLVNGTVKKAPKSRRKLNPSQSSNQLAPVTNGAKLGCFNKGRPTVGSNAQQPGSTGSAPDTQHKLTEYFPVRRSERKTKKTVMEERQRTIEDAVLTCKEDGLEVHNFEGKGRGIVARRHFTKGEFVVEYAGELIKMDEAREREKLYAQDQNTGCYMYYFKYKNNQFCVDATPESDRLGRLVNHSRNGNLTTKTIAIGNVPRLVLIAKEDIQPGEEVTYDYGDRSKESLRYHPWLAT